MTKAQMESEYGICSECDSEFPELHERDCKVSQITPGWKAAKHEESCRCEDCESTKIDSIMDQEENEAAKEFERKTYRNQPGASLDYSLKSER